MKFLLYNNCTVKIGIGALQSAGTPASITTVDRSALCTSFRPTRSVNFKNVQTLADSTDKSLAVSSTGTVEIEINYDGDTGNVNPIFFMKEGYFVKLELVLAEGTPVTQTFTGVIQTATQPIVADEIVKESATIKLGVAYYAGLE
ncbi:hypothetical protein UFOVP757_20 [uncultured Caudovirales phage]|jgi:hypothetical protein|uniref:Uncharacterized protein n=1 Tax=uncultured Caudovirales phage TaxID=2100421 RepID=A0A6J7XAM4_9CAUD|nr:hypothetical protein UFOVP757_20 [uncultured Caudovirales phage]